MQTEIEAKFLDVDPDAIRHKLRTAHAVLLQKEMRYLRTNYDFPDGRLRARKGWIRLRDEGGKITLTYKELKDRSLHGTKEVSITVDSFARTEEFLNDIGLVEKSVQETRRERWNLDESEVTIDTWPWVPPFLEIEAPTETDVRAVAALLGLPWKKAVHGSVEIVYQRYFNVTEDDVDSWKRITFEPTPAWLAAKRKVAKN
jgi:adenylate cyclase class 2